MSCVCGGAANVLHVDLMNHLRTEQARAIHRAEMDALRAATDDTPPAPCTDNCVGVTTDPGGEWVCHRHGQFPVGEHTTYRGER